MYTPLRGIVREKQHQLQINNTVKPVLSSYSKEDFYDLISKFQVGHKSLLRQGLSEAEFYGDLVYKLI